MPGRSDLDKILAADPLLASIISKLGATPPASGSGSRSSGGASGSKGGPAPGLKDQGLYQIPFQDLQLLKVIGEGRCGGGGRAGGQAVERGGRLVGMQAVAAGHCWVAGCALASGHSQWLQCKWRVCGRGNATLTERARCPPSL